MDVIVDGKLDDDGSRTFIGRFLLGGGISRDAQKCSPLIAAKEPRVTDVEIATTTALKYWESQNLRLCREPVLGMGLTGIVIAMTLPTGGSDGADASGDAVEQVPLNPSPSKIIAHSALLSRPLIRTHIPNRRSSSKWPSRLLRQRFATTFAMRSRYTMRSRKGRINTVR